MHLFLAVTSYYNNFTAGISNLNVNQKFSTQHSFGTSRLHILIGTYLSNTCLHTEILKASAILPIHILPKQQCLCVMHILQSLQSTVL